MPTPTLVQATTEARSSGASSLAWSFGSGVTAGNYIVVSVASVTSSGDPLGLTDSQGTSYSLAVRSSSAGGSTNDFRVSLYYGKPVSTAAGATLTLTATAVSTASRWVTAAAEFSNMLASTASVLSTTAAGGNTTASLSVSITGTSTAGLILGAAGGNLITTGGVWTQQGAPWVNLYDEPDGNLYHHSMSEYRTVTSAATYASTWVHSTLGGTAGLRAVLALFEGSTVAGGTARPMRLALLGVV